LRRWSATVTTQAERRHADTLARFLELVCIGRITPGAVLIIEHPEVLTAFPFTPAPPHRTAWFIAARAP
jgi:hypothetical protein